VSPSTIAIDWRFPHIGFSARNRAWTPARTERWRCHAHIEEESRVAAMKVEVIAVPYDSGRHSARMGRGPDHLLELGVVNVLQSAGAEVRVHHVAPAPDVFPAEIPMAFDLQRALDIARQLVGRSVLPSALPRAAR
jgi:hypothetical protein